MKPFKVVDYLDVNFHSSQHIERKVNSPEADFSRSEIPFLINGTLEEGVAIQPPSTNIVTAGVAYSAIHSWERFVRPPFIQH